MTNKLTQNEMIDLYIADWKVKYKCDMLVNIAQRVDDGRGEVEDLILAIEITEQVEILIHNSETIPDKYKTDLIKDISNIRTMFANATI
jgi:hypothetical protein